MRDFFDFFDFPDLRLRFLDFFPDFLRLRLDLRPDLRLRRDFFDFPDLRLRLRDFFDFPDLRLRLDLRPDFLRFPDLRLRRFFLLDLLDLRRLRRFDRLLRFDFDLAIYLFKENILFLGKNKI